jgi:NAD(P) transhydrogenase
MREMGIHLMLGEEIENIAIESGRRRNLAVIQVQNGRRVKADRLLAAAGRESNTGALGLECVGIETDQTGLVKVNDMFATCTATIHAVGDVIGFPALAGTSMHQGRMAMLHAFGQPTPPSRDLPLAVYTIPEISMVGKTEENCRELGISFEVGVARFAESARGQIDGIRDDMLKIVFRREDHVLLGVHMIGANASELVHIGMTMVHAGGTVDQLADTVFNYPTLSEAYRVAALDGLNRL